jgi:carbon-monoxide dehydrogenase large subunit
VLHPNLAGYVGLPKDRPADAPPNQHGFWSHEAGDLAAGFAAAELIFEATYQTAPQHQGYLEPHSVLAQAQPDGSLDIWLTNKTPFPARKTLAAALDLPLEQVRVHPASIGGDFGGKGNVMQAPLAALLSRASGRPVRLVLTYVEELLAANPRHSIRVGLKVGARRDGRLTALQADMLLDGGAYGGMKPQETLLVGGVMRIGGPYRIPNARLVARSVYTNTVPRGHMRAPGEPQVIFARELMLDELARALQLDPVELRRRNLLAEGEQRLVGGRWTHPTSTEVLRRASEAIEWERPREPNIGRGLAISDRGVGSGHSGAIVRLELDGTVELTTAVPDTGTGAHTVLQQLAAEALGLEPSRIRIRIGGTDEAPDDSGAGGSRVTHVAGQAADRAAREAARQLGLLASETYGWPEGEVVLRDGRVGPSASFDQEALPLEQVLRRLGEPLEARLDYHNEERSPEQSFTAQAAEVEVDLETGQVRVRRFVTAHDVGAILNPQTHQGQIEGGLLQGFGLALMEEVGIDRQDGTVSTLSLGEYKLPSLGDVPSLETILVPGGSGPVPFGGKGIGEASASAVAPAIAAAVLDAIGRPIRDLPDLARLPHPRQETA